MENYEQLKKVMRGVPDDLRKNLGREEKVYSDHQVELAKRAIDHKDTPPEYKEALKKAMQDGTFERTRLVMDDKKTKKLEEETEGRIKAAIAKGELEHPDKVNDPWLEKQKARMGIKESFRINADIEFAGEERTEKYCGCKEDDCEHVCVL